MPSSHRAGKTEGTTGTLAWLSALGPGLSIGMSEIGAGVQNPDVWGLQWTGAAPSEWGV